MVVASLAIYTSATLAWFMISMEKSKEILGRTQSAATLANLSSEPRVGSTSVAHRPYDTHTLRHTKLFGSPKIEVEQVVTKNLPQTSSTLRLKGVFDYGSTATSRALIESSGETQSYGVGDEVPGDRTIAGITEGVVVLESRQGLERLEFDTDQFAFEFYDAAPQAQSGVKGSVPSEHESGVALEYRRYPRTPLHLRQRRQ